jgi:putative transposase
LRPGVKASERLTQENHRARYLWNQAVEKLTTENKWFSDKDLTVLRKESDWIRSGSSVSQQQELRDFRQAKGRKKFKSAKRDYPSVNYTKRGFSLVAVNGKTRLKLAGGYLIPVVWSRPLPSEPSSVRVYQDNLGHWYASFVVEVETQELPKTWTQVGIDWGFNTWATTSDLTGAYDLPNARHSRKAQAQLARAQREYSRRKKGSKGQAASRLRVAKLHKKVARQRVDTAHKWSKNIVSTFDEIAVEDFKPKFMFKNKLAKSAADASVGALKKVLIEKAGQAGRSVVMVKPAYTTMTCSECSSRAKKRLGLSVRVFDCDPCGFRMDRDRNAARVILATAGFNRATVESVRLTVPSGAGLLEVEIPRL